MAVAGRRKNKKRKRRTGSSEGSGASTEDTPLKKSKNLLSGNCEGTIIKDSTAVLSSHGVCAICASSSTGSSIGGGNCGGSRSGSFGSSEKRKRRRRNKRSGRSLTTGGVASADNTTPQRNASCPSFRIPVAEEASRKRVHGESEAEANDDDHDDKDVGTAVVPDFPFETVPDDHCETPAEAYRDISPLLDKVASGTGGAIAGGGGGSLDYACRRRNSLRIYDPYYCNGAVTARLSALGYPNVYNEKVDCYEVWRGKSSSSSSSSSLSLSSSRYPTFDVVITNPPYSGDHIERLIQHVTAPAYGNKPWFLLLPTWVHKKDYYVQAVAGIRPFYLVPAKRYVYLPPDKFRKKKKSDVHKKSSPFCSMWYIWGGSTDKNEKLIRHYLRSYHRGSADDVEGSSSTPRPTCALARSRSALRDLRRKGKRR